MVHSGNYFIISMESSTHCLHIQVSGTMLSDLMKESMNKQSTLFAQEWHSLQQSWKHWCAVEFHWSCQDVWSFKLFWSAAGPHLFHCKYLWFMCHTFLQLNSNTSLDYCLPTPWTRTTRKWIDTNSMRTTTWESVDFMMRLSHIIFYRLTAK